MAHPIFILLTTLSIISCAGVMELGYSPKPTHLNLNLSSMKPHRCYSNTTSALLHQPSSTFLIPADQERRPSAHPLAAARLTTNRSPTPQPGRSLLSPPPDPDPNLLPPNPFTSQRQTIPTSKTATPKQDFRFTAHAGQTRTKVAPSTASNAASAAAGCPSTTS
jgi:hypothetical protein